MHDIESVSQTPTVSNAVAYSSGDLVGGKLTFADLFARSQQGCINTVVLEDLGRQNAALALILFDADPTATTFTDNAALDIADADLPKVIGHVPIAATDYVSLADNSFATVRNLWLDVKSTSDTIYGALVTTGTPTYTSTADVTVTVTVRRARVGR